jgi:tetratricopeptide (TPR) repeat protein
MLYLRRFAMFQATVLECATLGGAYYLIGHSDKALKLAERTLSAAESYGDTYRQLVARLYVGYNRLDAGRHREAHQLFSELLTQANAMPGGSYHHAVPMIKAALFRSQRLLSSSTSSATAMRSID